MLYTITFNLKDSKGIEWLPKEQKRFNNWSYAEDYINEKIESLAGERMLFFASKQGEAEVQVYEVFLNSEVKHTVTL